MGKLKQERLIENLKEKEINLKEYYLLIKKRFWIVIVITILTTSAGYFYSSLNNTLLYQSSTRVIIGSEEGGDMKTLLVMIKDPIIMEKVIDELELTRSADAIAAGITAEIIDDSRVVKISVTDQNPQTAAAIANTTAEVFKREIVNLLDFRDVQLLSEAKENPSAINQTQNKTTIIGFVFGIIVGVGLIFLLDALDTTVKHESEIELILGVPVIGIVSNMNKKKVVEKKVKVPVVESRSETVDIS
ncbi:capsular biosynthesis protein [Virgibacillus phasianinus]|uniref:Capsular biosynthesis protein n=1 Tax=Virgibacillus phasianinus TaxID=2017483 RepID=A0A220U6Z1_9BACI|nr:Wzz/FepE/Etk N-terminal domain-containing protein [Virgibacillus phasianinus]ASK63732.1 capsular biosynthesis protein [Virgibacillus phasianinus]